MHLTKIYTQVADYKKYAGLRNCRIQKSSWLRILLPFIFLCIFYDFSNASSVQLYTVNEGLSLNEVRGIYQDKYMKYLWIYTQNGLNRYNGNSIKKLYIEREVFKPNNFINDITEDNNNNLWIATNNGLARFNYMTNNWFPLPHELLTGKYKHICYFKDSLFYGIRNGSLVQIHIDAKAISFQKIDIPAKTITDIISFKKELIVGTSSGIFSYRLTEKKAEKIIPELNFCSKLKILNQDSSLWVKTKNSCYIIPIIKDRLEISQMKDYHHHLLKQTGIDYKIGDVAFKDNKYWFATQNGIVTVNKTSDRIKLHNSLNYWMNSLLYDNKGNLWCGTWQKGVVKIPNKKKLFNSFLKSDINSGIPSGLISSIVELDSNRIALATETEGLVIFNRKTNSFQEIYNTLNTSPKSDFFVKHNIMHCVKRDWEGRIWGGYYTNGFNVISGKNKDRINQVIKDYIDKIGNLTCDDFCFDTENNNVYIASSEGLLLFDNSAHRISNIIKSKNVSALLKDAAGNLWVGTRTGLIIHDTKTHTTNLKLEEKAKRSGVFSDGINCFYTDSVNNIWIGTYGEGLYHYKVGEESFHQIQQPVHIDFKVVYSIVEDKEGTLWLGTNSGLVKYDYQNNRFSRYSKFDGIQDNQFNYNSATKANDGTIFMGGINGFTYFNPQNIKEKIELPRPVISDIIINEEINKRTKGSLFNTSLSVPFSKNSFEIAFYTPDYTSPENYIYKYYLEGYSTKERICPPNTHKLFFSDVPPGKYILKLWVTLPNSEWSEVTTGSEIRVLPPWYKSIIAYCVYALVLIALFIVTMLVSKKQALYKSSLELVRLEKKQADQINQSKLRFFTDIAHEIRTPLTLILGPIKDILTNRKLDNDLQNSITQIHKSAIKLKDLMDELLLFRKAENGTLPLKLQENSISDLIKSICESYQYEFSAKNIRLDYSRVSNIIAVYDNEKMEKVLSNLISNAIKHTPEDGSITISINANDNTLNFSVQDTGSGITSDEIDTIFNRFYQSAYNKEQGFGIGLALAKKIIEAHNGHLTVKSTLGKGSAFSVDMPYLKPNIQSELKPIENDINEDTFAKVENVIHKKTIKGNILIVEDNIEISNYIASIFEREYDVIIKGNGKEGFEYAMSNIPDIIITDYQMPEMDGIAMCQKLKQEFKTSHIPIILLSAFNEVEEQLKGFESGANDYIGKPFHSDILLQKIGNIIQSRKQLIVSFKKGDNIDLSRFELQDQRFLDKLNKIIAIEMANETFGVPVLCEKLGVSKTTLNDKLRRMLDVSTAEYIKKTRLKEAYRLLTKENYSPSDAAYAVGFSPAYFTVCFKKEYGVSPGKI